MKVFSSFIKMAAAPPQPGAQAMASAAAAAMPVGGVPLPKAITPQPEPEPEGDGSLDVSKIEENHRKELEAKDKEIRTLSEQKQLADVQAAQEKSKWIIQAERNKMQQSIAAERERAKSEIDSYRDGIMAQVRGEQEQINLNKVRYETEADKHNTRLEAASAQQRADIATSKAEAMSEIADFNAKRYVKTTDDARSESDKYLQKRKETMDANNRPISVALEEQMNGAIKAMHSIGKTRNMIASHSLPKVASAPLHQTNFNKAVIDEVNRFAPADFEGNGTLSNNAIAEARMRDAISIAQAEGNHSRVKILEGARAKQQSSIDRMHSRLSQAADAGDAEAKKQLAAYGDLTYKRNHMKWWGEVDSRSRLDEIAGASKAKDALKPKYSNDTWYGRAGNIARDIGDGLGNATLGLLARAYNTREGIKASEAMAKRHGVDMKWFGEDGGTQEAKESFRTAAAEYGLGDSKWNHATNVGLNVGEAALDAALIAKGGITASATPSVAGRAGAYAFHKGMPLYSNGFKGDVSAQLAAAANERLGVAKGVSLQDLGGLEFYNKKGDIASQTTLDGRASGKVYSNLQNNKALMKQDLLGGLMSKAGAAPLAFTAPRGQIDSPYEGSFLGTALGFASPFVQDMTGGLVQLKGTAKMPTKSYEVIDPNKVKQIASNIDSSSLFSQDSSPTQFRSAFNRASINKARQEQNSLNQYISNPTWTM